MRLGPIGTVLPSTEFPEDGESTISIVQPQVNVRDKTVIYLALGSTLSCYIYFNLHFTIFHYRRLLLECM